MGSHDQRGQNRPPAANQMLTKHLTGCLTENAHRNKTAGKHRRPTRPFEPDTRSHHRKSRVAQSQTSTNEHLHVDKRANRSQRVSPTTRQKMTSHWGPFLNNYFTAPAHRRLRLRRPGHRPWHSPRASCRCGRRRPHTPAWHRRRHRPCEPRGASPRQPSRAADGQR